jgi:hypothetical protein
MALRAAQTLFRCFPHHAQTTESETFLAGAVVVLAAYPDDVMQRAVHPLTGLPGKLKFVPTIAELKVECDAIMAEGQRRAEMAKRYGARVDPQQKRIAAAWHKPTGPATVSGLCDRFGLTSLPAGWDAIDVTVAAARHGADLPRVVDEMNRTMQPQSHQKGAFDAVADMARRAKQIRAEYEREGLEPVYIGEDIVTIETAEKLGRLRRADPQGEGAEF